MSQPVSGTEIAFATANDVMTQVPWSDETPRSPEMVGIATFAIDESSTFMKTASDTRDGADHQLRALERRMRDFRLSLSH